MVSVRVNLNLNFSFAPELNEKEVIELENATPGSIKKATNYGMKIFQGQDFKTLT